MVVGDLKCDLENRYYILLYDTALAHLLNFMIKEKAVCLSLLQQVLSKTPM